MLLVNDSSLFSKVFYIHCALFTLGKFRGDGLYLGTAHCYDNLLAEVDCCFSLPRHIYYQK